MRWDDESEIRNSKSEICSPLLLPQTDEFSTAKRGGPMARRIAVQGTERNPFSANYFPPKSHKLRNWRKITPIPSIWMRKTTHLTDCGSSPSECKLFKSRTMTHTTQRAAGSSAPLRWPPVGKAYSIVDHSGSSSRGSLFLLDCSLSQTPSQCDVARRRYARIVVQFRVPRSLPMMESKRCIGVRSFPARTPSRSLRERGAAHEKR